MLPVKLGAIILVSFAIPLSLRPLLVKKLVHTAGGFRQPIRSFYIDFAICIVGGIFLNGHNYFMYGIALPSLLPPMFGCLIAGMFIGLDSALAQERRNIVSSLQDRSSGILPEKFFSMTRKFTFVAITAVIFVAIVLMLVFSRDIQWLADNVQMATAVHDATVTVYKEIFFIMLVLIILLINLIFSYSKNLKLLFENETRILEKVSNGDLSDKVPVATRDEFGFIAGHTNRMIDGLRHRFELLNSLKLAEEVQQNLLPDSSPYRDGIEICGTSRYSEQTGGDYYDYFLLPNGNVGIVVADAVGHGIGAAMLMTSVRAFMTSAISRYGGPAGLIGEVNSFITRDCSKSGRFSSLFFMELDAGTRQFTWVRAGHEPPVIYHAKSKRFSLLEEGDMVLGIDPDVEFHEFTAEPLSIGDIFFLGTDGISEARNTEGAVFGRERIMQCIAKEAAKPAQEIQAALLEELDTFCGKKNQEDDVTLVLVKITASS